MDETTQEERIAALEKRVAELTEKLAMVEQLNENRWQAHWANDQRFPGPFNGPGVWPYSTWS